MIRNTDSVKVCSGEIYLATWNVEGLSEVKEEILERIMQQHNIHILCLQETHRPSCNYWISNAGFLFILSGGEDENEREYAGVGFIIAPILRQSVLGFCQHSNRMACLKLKCKYGKAAIVSAYAPHNERPIDERTQFFSNLASFYSSISVNGLKLIVGDLNSRLYTRYAGEEQIIGNHFFESTRSRISMNANRFLLTEMCTSCNLAVANSFFDVPVENQVTYFDIGQYAMADVDQKSFAQLDILLCPQDCINKINSCYSDRLVALSSHHFLVKASINMQLDRTTSSNEFTKHAYGALCDPRIRDQVLSKFKTEYMGSRSNLQLNAQDYYDSMLTAYTSAIQELPEIKSKPKRPWISDSTLQLIDQRSEARRTKNQEWEKRLTKEIKFSVKMDRNRWLIDLASTGNWDDLRKLKNSKRFQKGRMQNEDGQIVDSDLRAQSLAEYFEKFQWHVRPTQYVPNRTPIFCDLHVYCGDITADEILKAIKKFKKGKSPGDDKIPVEFWKYACEDSIILTWLVEFCSIVWHSKQIPQQWSLACVAALYKKGNPQLPQNYRPISLLSVGYKIFAAILLNRLKSADAEKRIWSTQFGFRSGFGTIDALFIARRMIDQSLSAKDNHLIFLALDWSKAFDSISPQSLQDALRRFGLPDALTQVIASIYRNRQFYVKEAGVKSNIHHQHFGISQGCPLSPFLFSIIMTVLIWDAKAILRETHFGNESHDPDLHELLFADDTLLIGADDADIRAYLQCIQMAGREYGLELNFDKFELLALGKRATILKNDGTAIEQKHAINYLGSLLTDDGRISAELGRRLGLAMQEFKALKQVWQHSSLSRKDKIHIYTMCVLSKLTYGLQTAVLRAVERRKINGFHCRCLRQICGILPAFLSRISNHDVLQVANSYPLSNTILEQQMLYMGKLCRNFDHPARCFIFEPNSLSMKNTNEKKKCGRPRMLWQNEVLKFCHRAAESNIQMMHKIMDANLWKECVREFCRQIQEL